MGVWKPLRVNSTGKYGYGYGYWFLYPPALKRAQEHAKWMRIDWDIVKYMIQHYFLHFSSVLDDLTLILMGKPPGWRVGVYTGTGTGPGEDTWGLPLSFTTWVRILVSSWFYDLNWEIGWLSRQRRCQDSCGIEVERRLWDQSVHLEYFLRISVRKLESGT